MIKNIKIALTLIMEYTTSCKILTTNGWVDKISATQVLIKSSWFGAIDESSIRPS